MSDLGPEDLDARGGPPTAPPTISLETETAVRTGGIGARAVALVLGAVMLLGGVGFAATQLGSDDGSPEDAVADLFAAINDEDVLGALAALDPGERDALQGPIERTFAELQRLELLSEEFRLDGVPGIDLDLRDLEYRVEPVRDDLARVYVLGGTGTFAFDTDELPLGDLLTDTLDRFELEYRGQQDRQESSLAADDTFLVVRNGADGWRISLGYTAAEAARVSSGAGPAPALGTGLEPIGEDSPEAAVEEFVRDAIAFDVAGLAARLSPNEFGALQDYWSLFVDDATLPAGPEELGASISLNALSLRSDTSGDAATVFVDGFDVTAGAEGIEAHVTFGDGCVEVELSGDVDQLQLDEAGLDDFVGQPYCTSDYQDAIDDMVAGFDLSELGIETDLDVFSTIRTPAVGITTHRVDGQWYLAPISTSMNASVAGLESIDRVHLEAVIDLGVEIFEAFTQSFESSVFGPDFGGGSLGPDPYSAELDPATEEIVRGLIAAQTPDQETAYCAFETMLQTLPASELDRLATSTARGEVPPEYLIEALDWALLVCGP